MQVSAGHGTRRRNQIGNSAVLVQLGAGTGRNQMQETDVSVIVVAEMWFLVFDLALDLSWARTRRVPVPRTWISASAVAESARTGQCMCVSAYMSVLVCLRLYVCTCVSVRKCLRFICQYSCVCAFMPSLTCQILCTSVLTCQVLCMSVLVCQESVC